MHSMMKKNLATKILHNFATAVCAALAFISFSCNSVPEEIPEDLDASQLIQLGQDNYDSSKYAAAEAYFTAVIDRYGNDAKHYIEATYELGHLYMKQKRYEEAITNFNEILEIYESAPAGIPGAYRRLSQIELEKVPQKALDEIEAKKKAREADLAAEAEKVKAEEEARIRAAAERAKAESSENEAVEEEAASEE